MTLTETLLRIMQTVRATSQVTYRNADAPTCNERRDMRHIQRVLYVLKSRPLAERPRLCFTVSNKGTACAWYRLGGGRVGAACSASSACDRPMLLHKHQGHRSKKKKKAEVYTRPLPLTSCLRRTVLVWTRVPIRSCAMADLFSV